MLNEWNQIISERLAERKKLLQEADEVLQELDADLYDYQQGIERTLLEALKSFYKFHQTTDRHHFCRKDVEQLLEKFGLSLEELR